MSVVITNNVNVYNAQNDTIPYAGVFIQTLDEYKSGLNVKAKKYFKANHFMNILKNTEHQRQHCFIQISVIDIENYYF